MRQVYQMVRPGVVAKDRRELYGSMLEEGGALAWLGGWKAQCVEAMTDFIDPFDHEQDRTLKFALYSMWYQASDNTKEMDFVVAVLGGNGAICWIPLTILLPIYG